MQRRLWTLFALLAWIVAATAVGQPVPPADIKTKITLEDGSEVRAALVTKSITVETPYGDLVIPCGDIRSIRFGNHLSPEQEKELALSIKGISSSVFAEREKANKSILRIGRRALPALELAAMNSDAEGQRRAALLAADIAEADSRPIQIEDVVVTSRLEVRGKIKSGQLAFRSTVLGEFGVNLPDLASMLVQGNRSGVFRIDGAKYGTKENSWFSTGLTFDNGSTLNVTADGTVDIWPTNPGQHLCQPKGYNTTGRGGKFMAGALIGKIGKDGAEFFVGEKLSSICHSQEVGLLYFRIVPHPWGVEVPASGEYVVRVKSSQ